jgi:hypothetical protein
LSKVKPQIRINRADLKDLVRDELYGAVREKYHSAKDGKLLLVIPSSEVKELAKRVAARAMVGH